MVSMLVNWLWPERSSDGPEETSAKIAALLKEFNETDSEPVFERTRQDQPAKSACTRREGVITSLNKTGGVINRKYEFENIDAGDQWKDLKVGKKITVSRSQ